MSWRYGQSLPSIDAHADVNWALYDHTAQHIYFTNYAVFIFFAFSKQKTERENEHEGTRRLQDVDFLTPLIQHRPYTPLSLCALPCGSAEEEHVVLPIPRRDQTVEQTAGNPLQHAVHLQTRQTRPATV